MHTGALLGFHQLVLLLLKSLSHMLELTQEDFLIFSTMCMWYVLLNSEEFVNLRKTETSALLKSLICWDKIQCFSGVGRRVLI